MAEQVKEEERRECQRLSLDYGSYGYPCHLRAALKAVEDILRIKAAK